MTEQPDQEQERTQEELEEQRPDELPAPTSTSVINPHVDGVATRIPAPPADTP